MTQQALTDEQAYAHVHTGHLTVVRLGKAALLAGREVGAVLHEHRNHLGDGFGARVDGELNLSLDEADGYIRFFEECDLSPSQLSPAVHLELARVIEGLGRLEGAFSTTTTKLGRNGDADPAGELASPKPANTTSQPSRKAESSDPCSENRESRLTEEQKKLLLDRSPKLYADVRKGALSAEEAVRAAQDLPIRKPPQQTLSQERRRQAPTANSPFSETLT